MWVFNAIVSRQSASPFPHTPILLTNLEESNLYTSACSSKPYNRGLLSIIAKN